MSQNMAFRLDCPCRLFAGLGFLPPVAENLEKLCVFGRPIAKTLRKRVFGGAYWGAKGERKEVQGNEGRK